jgi:NAD(P)-dependent dehydrogenase (short-subunit alcohol dehydrogenase family)
VRSRRGGTKRCRSGRARLPDAETGRSASLSRILVLGGYGGFGGRLTRRLAGRGHHVLVGGRNAAKAAAFCAGLAGTEPVVADRDGGIGRLLAEHRPDLLIDAAGPFQGIGYHVPLACVRASVPCLDLADARGFVAGIGSLDDLARAAGIAVISGASSVPALSGAVARGLADGLDRVSAVELSISASNRATAGASVAKAILSYVGKPVQLWRGRRWTEAWGWQEFRRETFAVEGSPALRGRWVALADVPDHQLLPEMLPGRPAVTFRAGTDVALQTLGLWFLSWPVRWLRKGSAARLAFLLPPLKRLTGALGSDRSAMRVTLKGVRGTRGIQRQWTLIADAGDGPEIPTLAAVLLAEAVLAGTVPPGARNAGSLLGLHDFEPLFSSLAVRHRTVEVALPPPFYERVMGARYTSLPDAVREMHRVHADAGASGEAIVKRGSGMIARCIAWFLRFPPAGRHALHVAFTERDGVERWTREFGRYSFSSRLSGRAGHLVEQFGPLRFRFELPSDEHGLAMRMVGWSWLGLPLPLALAPRSHAREWQEDGSFRFDVPIALPLVGLVVHYSGWLTPDM